MAGGISDDDEEITGINVTPLVDVMLVLLIIFMVTATYIVHKSINIKLPKAATATSEASSKNLAFAIDQAGTLYLDGNPISFEQIGASISAMKQTLAADAQLQALITADEATPHGTVIKLIDAVRKNGVTDFAINVEVEEKK